MNYHLYQGISEVDGIDEKEVKKNVYDLWQECFEDTDSYTDFYFDWKLKDNQIFLIYKGKKLAAMLHLNPYTLVVKGEEVSANYIVGVATQEKERRKGLMSRLIEASLYQMYESKMPFTYLMPAKESIYLPFDFEIVYEQELWNEQLEEARLKVLEEEKAPELRAASEEYKMEDLKVIALGEEDTENIEKLTAFTNQLLIGEKEVFVKRTPYYYKRLIHEMQSGAGEVLLCFDQRELIGYIAYMAEEEVYITECITYAEEKERVLMEVSNFLSHMTKLKIHTGKPDAQVPAIMARIVNLKTFVKMIKTKLPLQLIIEVEDPIMKENQGTFLLECNREGGQITNTSESPDIRIHVRDLIKLFFGKLPEEDYKKLLIHNTKENRNKIMNLILYQNVFINDVV